jgi:hypothetical protein
VTWLAQNWLLIAVTLAYSIQAALYARKHPAQALMLAGYAIANVGLLWSLIATTANT